MEEAVIAHIDREAETDFADVPARRHATKETAHGRQETRVYLPGFARWAGLKTTGMVLSLCGRDGEETAEMRYHLSSLPMGVKRFARAVRGHWSIENSCHWSLDVIRREDHSRIREKHVRENFAWLNRFTLSLLKQHPGKDGIAMKRRSCAWSDEFLAEVLTGTMA